MLFNSIKNGWIKILKGEMKISSEDITFILLSFIPNSSEVSLMAVTIGVSSFSIFPPGKQISFGWYLKVLDLTSKSIKILLSFCTKGIVTEARF